MTITFGAFDTLGDSVSRELTALSLHLKLINVEYDGGSYLPFLPSPHINMPTVLSLNSPLPSTNMLSLCETLQIHLIQLFTSVH